VQVCVGCKCARVHVCVGCKCVLGASVCRIHVCVGYKCVSGKSVCRGQKLSCKPESLNNYIPIEKILLSLCRSKNV
jgi:hypothetical protein